MSLQNILWRFLSQENVQKKHIELVCESFPLCLRSFWWIRISTSENKKETTLLFVSKLWPTVSHLVSKKTKRISRKQIELEKDLQPNWSQHNRPQCERVGNAGLQTEWDAWSEKVQLDMCCCVSVCHDYFVIFDTTKASLLPNIIRVMKEGFVIG